MLKAKWNHTDIVDEESFEHMCDQFYTDKPYIIAGAFDTETTGPHHIYDKPFLFQFGWVTSQLEGHTYTVDLEQQEALARRVINVWQFLAKRLPVYLGHNVKFDLHMGIS